jgi:hypothetical protein
MTADENDPEQFGTLLGAAVIDLWGELPQDVQQALFEAAVAAGSSQLPKELMREHLAVFLHERHPRTEAAGESIPLPE